MRAIGRWLGYALLAFAVIAAGYDGYEAARDGVFRSATLGEWWAAVSPRSLDAALGLSPWLTERFVAGVVAAPAWAVLGVPGVLLALICRRRDDPRRRRSRGR